MTELTFDFDTSNGTIFNIIYEKDGVWHVAVHDIDEEMVAPFLKKYPYLENLPDNYNLLKDRDWCCLLYGEQRCCINNDNCPELILGKLYQCWLEPGLHENHVRAFDESGESYLYPKQCFYGDFSWTIENRKIYTS